MISPAEIRADDTIYDGIIGRSSAMAKVVEQVRMVAPTDSTVLICGETGTGKELVARAVHQLSARRARAFVKVNAGRKRIGQEVAAQLANHAVDDALTAREVEVLQLIAAGNANKIIADRLSLSEDTIKGHVKNILSKLGANDRTHAVTMGLKRGIISL